MRYRARTGHVFMLLLLLGLSTPSPGFRWFGADRVKHFFLSFFVQSVGYSAARAANASNGPALVAASGVTAAVAVSKELWDRKHGRGFDVGDLLWDGLGAGAASGLLVRTVRE